MMEASVAGCGGMEVQLQQVVEREKMGEGCTVQSII
jgi:hypothetical protein